MKHGLRTRRSWSGILRTLLRRAETSVRRGLEPGESDMTPAGLGVAAETMTGETEGVDGNRAVPRETVADEARFDEGYQGEVDADGPPSPPAGASPDALAAADGQSA